MLGFAPILVQYNLNKFNRVDLNLDRCYSCRFSIYLQHYEWRRSICCS